MVSCGFQFYASLFYKYKNLFLREKRKWNGKLENGSGLKNAVMHLCLEESKGDLKFQILLMTYICPFKCFRTFLILAFGVLFRWS